MKTYQIRNEVTGEIVETTGHRYWVRKITSDFMKENRLSNKPCRTFFRSVSTVGIKFIYVQPINPKHEFYSTCFDMLYDD